MMKIAWILFLCSIECSGACFSKPEYINNFLYDKIIIDEDFFFIYSFFNAINHENNDKYIIYYVMRIWLLAI